MPSTASVISRQAKPVSMMFSKHVEQTESSIRPWTSIRRVLRFLLRIFLLLVLAASAAVLWVPGKIVEYRFHTSDIQFACEADKDGWHICPSWPGISDVRNSSVLNQNVDIDVNLSGEETFRWGSGSPMSPDVLAYRREKGFVATGCGVGVWYAPDLTLMVIDLHHAWVITAAILCLWFLDGRRLQHRIRRRRQSTASC